VRTSEYDIADTHANKIVNYEVERMLRLFKNTAPGNNDILCWVIESCSFELAGMVADIINYSFLTGVVPSSWLTSIVIPIQKFLIQRIYWTIVPYQLLQYSLDLLKNC
jgi:hypothetical protein